MAAPIAWFLNLDADLELGRGATYQPTKTVLRAIKAQTERLADWLGPGDLVVDASSPTGCAEGFVGRAFCPTPRALQVLRRTGAIPEAHPSLEILRRVNSRAFASSLGPTMPDAAFVTEMGVAEATLARPPAIGNAWRVKHAFGMAGRNQRIVHASSCNAADFAFLRAGLSREGVQIEPNVEIEVEYAVHGLLSSDGSCRFGDLVRQTCDARGAWRGTERIGDSDIPEVREPMAAEAKHVARALASAGYFGPFGVDAFTYRQGSGGLLLQPRSEINARYCMGFAFGFGAAGPSVRV